MSMLLWNLLLGLIWCLLEGRLDLPTLSAGLLLGWMALLIGSGSGAFSAPASGYFAKPFRFVKFFLFFLREMHVAQFRIAYDVVTLRHRSNPGIIAYPLDARTDAEITAISCILTLTPGTMALDVSPDRRSLYLHAMYIPPGGPGILAAQIKRRMELPLLELMR